MSSLYKKNKKFYLLLILFPIENLRKRVVEVLQSQFAQGHQQKYVLFALLLQADFSWLANDRISQLNELMMHQNRK